MDNTTTMPNWAKDILDALKCDKINVFDINGKMLYFGVNMLHNFSVDEEMKEGKQIYVISYSRRDCAKPDDDDKNAIISHLTQLLGKPVNFRKGKICDYLEFNGKKK